MNEQSHLLIIYKSPFVIATSNTFIFCNALIYTSAVIFMDIYLLANSVVTQAFRIVFLIAYALEKLYGGIINGKIPRSPFTRFFLDLFELRVITDSYEGEVSYVRNVFFRSRNMLRFFIILFAFQFSQLSHSSLASMSDKDFHWTMSAYIVCLVLSTLGFYYYVYFGRKKNNVFEIIHVIGTIISTFALQGAMTLFVSSEEFEFWMIIAVKCCVYALVIPFLTSRRQTFLELDQIPGKLMLSGIVIFLSFIQGTAYSSTGKTAREIEEKDQAASSERAFVVIRIAQTFEAILYLILSSFMTGVPGILHLYLPYLWIFLSLHWLIVCASLVDVIKRFYSKNYEYFSERLTPVQEMSQIIMNSNDLRFIQFKQIVELEIQERFFQIPESLASFLFEKVLFHPAPEFGFRILRIDGIFVLDNDTAVLRKQEFFDRYCSVLQEADHLPIRRISFYQGDYSTHKQELARLYECICKRLFKFGIAAFKNRTDSAIPFVSQKASVLLNSLHLYDSQAILFVAFLKLQSPYISINPGQVFYDLFFD